VLPDLSLLRVDIYEFDASDRLVRQVRAVRGHYSATGWQLADVHESAIDAQQVTTRRARLQDWPTGLTPDLFKVFTVRPEALSVPQLLPVHAPSRSEQAEYRPVCAGLLAEADVAIREPVVMMVVAIPFVFGLQRSGGVGARLFTGIVLGLAFF